MVTAGEVQGGDWPVCSETCPEKWRHVSRECEVIHVSGCPGTLQYFIMRDNRELEYEECPLYRAIMVLRVQQLEAEDQDYILEFMTSPH